MIEDKPSRDLVDVFLLLASMGALSLGLSGSCIFLSLQLFTSVAGVEMDGLIDPFTPLSLIVLSLSAIPSTLVSIRALRGQRIQFQNPSSPNLLWAFILLPIALFVGGLTIGQNLQPDPLGPFAHIASAIIPVLVAVVLVHRHGPLVSQRRFWGQLLIGVWVIPMMAVVIETVLMITGIVVIIVGMLGTPAGEALLEAATNPEVWSTPAFSENILTFFEQPLILMLFLGFIVILVPVLEELLKTLTIWPLFRRRLTSAEAFLSGVLAGAGFALVEALFLSPPGPEWMQTMIARTGATAMHTFTAGLTCWGIGQFLKSRRWKRFLASFLTAVLMHGLWNVAAIAVAIATLQGQSSEFTMPEFVASMISTIGIIILIVLTTIAVLGLFEIPRRLKHAQDLSSVTADTDRLQVSGQAGKGI
ncbi:MAG: PrsW family intramembrane metalloprotease [Anaerolineales bacterium]|nr:PrsW family intramembrane metalloprotease [Anaerolineales bacterium]